MSNTIWIVRRHPPHPFRHECGHLQAFTIHMATLDKSEAEAEAKRKNASKTTNHLYTVEKVHAKATNA